jgi:hypothetical protein
LYPAGITRPWENGPDGATDGGSRTLIEEEAMFTGLNFGVNLYS